MSTIDGPISRYYVFGCGVVWGMFYHLYAEERLLFFTVYIPLTIVWYVLLHMDIGLLGRSPGKSDPEPRSQTGSTIEVEE